jgi:hypothetical protein
MKIQNPNPKSQTNPELQIPKGIGGDWLLEFGICLEFGFWDLDFSAVVFPP